jgi:hypothetical protein
MKRDMKRTFLGFFYCWHYFLRMWVSKRSITSPDNNYQLESIRQNLMHKNKEFQEKFRILFTPYYHLCEEECLFPCCLNTRYPATKYDELDALIYGVPSELILRRSKGFRYLLKKIMYGEKARGKQFPCPNFGKNGCQIPWGNRLVVCVFFLCDPFAANMTSKEYCSFVFLLSKYLFFLTRCARQLLICS